MNPTCDDVQGIVLSGEHLPEDLAEHLEGCSSCQQVCSTSEVTRSSEPRREAASTLVPAWKPGDTVLEQYEIVQQIGWGGQGAVFLARDMYLRGLAVALKVVPEHGDAVEEVLHSVSITHTNVCCVRNARPAGKFLVIVMDYVAGGTLADLLSKGRIPLRQAIAIFRGICSGVREIHANKVRHLDLKPGNVLMRDGAVPVVSDFGLAALGGLRARGGTTGYMAPEQERGDLVDQRTDIYALGRILADLVPDPPRRLRAVIARARSQAIGARMESVDELLRQVDAALSGPSKANVLLAGGGVVLAAAGWTYVRRATSELTRGATPEVAERASDAPRQPVSEVPVSIADPPSLPSLPGPSADALPATSPPTQVRPAGPQPAAGTAAAGAASAAPTPAPATDSGRAITRALSASGSVADAQACVSSLDRLDLTPSNPLSTTRAQCLMRAGRCDEGRNALQAWYRKSQPGYGPELVSKTVSQTAAQFCPAADLTQPEHIQRIANQIYAAELAGDVAGCIRGARTAVDLWRSSSTRGYWDQSDMMGLLQGAAVAIGKSDRCEEARAVWRWRDQALRGTLDRDAAPWPAETSAAQFGQFVPGCAPIVNHPQPSANSKTGP